MAAGLAVVTKADLVAPDRVREVCADVRQLLAATTLAAAGVLPVSATTGQGMVELRRTLQALPTDSVQTGTGSPRLAIDRVFAVRGRGVVVTGTLRGGMVRVGDVLHVVPGELPVRVREVQVHGTTIEVAAPGRVALNLVGAGVGDLRRGEILATPGALVSSERLLVALRPTAQIRSRVPALPGDRANLRLHIGTDQVDARVGRAARDAVDLGAGRATAILRLERPIAVAAGDRFVLRRPSPGATAAGGIVLDAAPARGLSRRRASSDRLAALDAAVAALAAGDGDGDGDAGHARLALHGAMDAGRRIDLADDVRSEIRTRTVAALHAAGAGVPLGAARALVALELRRLVALDSSRAGRAGSAVLDELVADGLLVRDGDRVRIPGHTPAEPGPAEHAAMDRLVASLNLPAPPALAAAARAAGCPAGGVRALERAGRIVIVAEDLAWSSGAWRRLAETALERARAAPLTPAELRDATGTSRKYVMALLEDLNRRGILVRGDAGHRPGPRADALRDRDPVA